MNGVAEVIERKQIVVPLRAVVLRENVIPVSAVATASVPRRRCVHIPMQHVAIEAVARAAAAVVMTVAVAVVRVADIMPCRTAAIEDVMAAVAICAVIAAIPGRGRVSIAVQRVMIEAAAVMPLAAVAKMRAIVIVTAMIFM